MKGVVGGSSYTLPVKRRWRGLVIAVLGLVFLSMLVPLVFLLGLYNGFHASSGYATEQHSSTANGVRVYEQPKDAETRNKSKGDQSTHIDELIRRLGPTLSKDFKEQFVEADNSTGGLMVPDGATKKRPKANNSRFDGVGLVPDNRKIADETGGICELRFGSYCLWRQVHRERMEDTVVKKMKDLLYVARAYYPSIAKLPAFDKLSHELKQNIQDFERVLSESTTDRDLPSMIEEKINKMETTIARAKSCPVDCNNVDRKLRQLVDLTEDEANFHMKQSAFLYQLAVQTMPKSLHCLSMRLTVEYFGSPSFHIDQSVIQKYSNPEFYHFVIFSNNILASSAVINSTVMHAKESEKQVFHVLTDRQNYFAMKLWFFMNKYKEATVQVLNIEDLPLHDDDELGPLHLSLPEEFRVSFPVVEKSSATQIRTEYLSIFSHSHYLLPKIFDTLRKVVVLDDDIIVQRDLSDLWLIDMNGKVNGALQCCAVRLLQLKHYLAESIFDEKACAWMSGLNIIDLGRWREQDLTQTYQRLVQEMSIKEGSTQAVTLRASFLTFQGLIYALDDSWVLSGLGHNYDLNVEAISTAAVLHYNGNMKPWLELGVSKYKDFWRKFLNQDNQLLSDCNVN